jgi:hypothetical protein
MPPKHFPTLSIAAAGLAAFAVAGCGADKKADTTAPAAAQAPAATAPAPTTSTTTAPAATTAAPAHTTTAAASAPAGASDPVALAAATTNRQAGGVAFAMKGTVTTKGQQVPLLVRGTIDRRSQRGAFTSKTTLGARAFTVQEVTDKQQLYLRSPLFAGKLPGGKSWMKIDLAVAARTPGLDLDALGASGPSQDPAQGLDYLQGAGAAKRLGVAKINGVATTHYRVQVDLKRAAKRSAKATAKRSIDRLIATLGGPTTLPVDVWIDSDHLVRRQRVAYTATVSGQASGFSITTDYTAFDAKVDAKPPADGETFDGLAALKAAAKARQEAQQSQQAPQG